MENLCVSVPKSVQSVVSLGLAFAEDSRSYAYNRRAFLISLRCKGTIKATQILTQIHTYSGAHFIPDT